MVKFSVYLNRRVFVMIGTALKGKNFAPCGGKFFPLRATPILEAILGILFFKIFLDVRKNNSVLAKSLGYNLINVFT